jgi:hypothetical protein
LRASRTSRIPAGGQSSTTPRGQRAVGTAPHNHGPNLPLLATSTPTGIGADVVVEGATDGLVFEAFVE